MDIDVLSKHLAMQLKLGLDEIKTEEAAKQLLSELSNPDENHSTINNQIPTFETILTYSASRGLEGNVTFLVGQHMVNIDCKDRHGNTPLMIAILSEHTGIAKFLIDQGANVNAWSSGYGDVLSIAVRKRNEEIIVLLLNRGSNVNGHEELSCKPIEVAVKTGEVNVVKLLLDRGAKNLERALQRATAFGNKSCVELLLKHGANPDFEAHCDDNPLYIAVVNGYTKICELLLDYGGADVNVINNYNCTAVHAAAMTAHLDILKVLIERGAIIRQKDNAGCTPLHYATYSYPGCTSVIQTLVDLGLSLEDKDCYGRTPLFVAAKKGNLEGVKLLVALKADINVEDNLGMTVVEEAHTKKHYSISMFLVNRIALMRSKGLFVSENLLSRIEKIPLLKSYLVVCQEEIESLREWKICYYKSEGATYYDILKAKNVYQVAKIVRDEGIDQSQELSFEIDVQLFPLYGNEINDILNEGLVHKLSQDIVWLFFYHLATRENNNYRLPLLPATCQYKILKYFSLDDKLNLFNLYFK